MPPPVSGLFSLLVSTSEVEEKVEEHIVADLIEEMNKYGCFIGIISDVSGHSCSRGKKQQKQKEE